MNRAFAAGPGDLVLRLARHDSVPLCVATISAAIQTINDWMMLLRMGIGATADGVRAAAAAVRMATAAVLLAGKRISRNSSLDAFIADPFQCLLNWL